ncbi:TetR family transcriptional regulator [Streptomyces sp. NPDC002920]
MQDRQDRRVLRSRAALMAAAVRLVSEQGTTTLPVADLSNAADVSRQLVYLQFGDRDALLVAAAADLVERELLPEVRDDSAPHRVRLLAMARHFARHRRRPGRLRAPRRLEGPVPAGPAPARTPAAARHPRRGRRYRPQ